MDFDTKTVGGRVRKLRLSRGLSLEQLAQAIGVSLPTMSRIENGVGRLRVERLDALAQALGKTAAYFLHGNGKPVAEVPTVRIRPIRRQA